VQALPVIEPIGSTDSEEPTESRRGRMLRIADVNGVPVRAILFTIFAVVGIYLVGQVLFRLRTLLMIGLLSGFVALILNPLVVVLERWKVKRRGVAVAIVTVLALLVFFGLALAFGYPLVNGLTHFANSLPSYIDKAQHGRGWIGHLIRRYHVQDWVQRNSTKITSIATGLGKPALALGKGAVSILLMLFGVFTFVVLLLVEAPKMRRGLVTMLEPERAARFTRIGSAVSRSVSGYILGDLLTSLSAGVVVFVTLLTLGVALVDFLPTIGGALAGIPTVLFAFTHSTSSGVVTAIVFLLYTQVENHVLNPLVMSRTVRINPLLVFSSVLIGAEIGAWLGGFFGGFVAVLLAVPVAGSLQVIVQEYWRSSGADALEAATTTATNP
jgi:predicted PurR-regulated permease PerM